MTPDTLRLHSQALTSGDVVCVDRSGVARVLRWTPKPVSLPPLTYGVRHD